ncbi:hypothetical protein JCM1393_16190 [Clostridium carnis]
MVLAVQIFQIIFYSIGILFMIALSIIGIWGFIIFNKSYKTLRIHNFLLDKINQSLHQLIHISYKSNADITLDENFDVDDIINEEELFDETHDKKDNVLPF